MTKYLQVRCLIFAGSGSPSIHFEFEPGLNVIAVDSANTANLIIESVDFVLGAQRRPMLAGFGLNRIYLGITSSDGTSFTLERNIGGSAISLYDDIPSAGVVPHGAPKKLSPRHNPTVPGNVSKFLLDLIGLGEDCDWTKDDQTFDALSFRAIAHYFVCDEQSIHKERSLLEAGNSRTQDLELAIFDLLVGAYDPVAARADDVDKTVQLLRLARLQTLESVIEAAKRLRETAPAGTEMANAAAVQSRQDTHLAGARAPIDALIRELEDRKSALNWLTRRVDGSGSAEQISETPLDNLCRAIAALLNDWHMQDAPTVDFDLAERDFTILATPRADLDRTSRAVVHAAFKIALLQRAVQKGLLHAGFLLMHSPFPAGRESDDTTHNATQIKARFYETLAGSKAGQIIVVERGDATDLAGGSVQRAEFAKTSK